MVASMHAGFSSHLPQNTVAAAFQIFAGFGSERIGWTVLTPTNKLLLKLVHLSARTNILFSFPALVSHRFLKLLFDEIVRILRRHRGRKSQIVRWSSFTAMNEALRRCDCYKLRVSSSPSIYFCPVSFLIFSCLSLSFFRGSFFRLSTINLALIRERNNRTVDATVVTEIMTHKTSTSSAAAILLSSTA